MSHKVIKSKVHKVILLFIILLAVFFRFQNVNWDQGFHLHPDERFLTMVGNAMKTPHTVLDYLDPTISSFNPANIGYPFFVYGVFPVVLNKIIAIFLQNDTYGLFTLQGRVLSGLADMIALFFVYKTVLLFEKRKKISPQVKYWAAFLYATAVLPIQLSHFFATDTFLNVFVFGSFYFSLCHHYSSKSSDAFLSGLFFGLAIASKINAIFILPVLVFFLGIHLIRKRQFIPLLIIFFIFGVISYLTLRFAEPYYFESFDVFSLQPNGLFLHNMKELASLSSGVVFYPPAVQWYSKTPVLFSLSNLVFFGLGILSSAFTAIGAAFIIKKRKQAPAMEMFIIGVWVLGYFIFYSFQFAQNMRYFILIYPFLCIFAAFGIDAFMQYVTRKDKKSKTQKKVFYIKYLLLIFCLLIWPLLFCSIYLFNHTRYDASVWVYQHVADKSTILSEYWDDALPLPVRPQNSKMFNLVSVHVFDPDTPQKWTAMNEQLNSADYYILSSNRGWASISTVAAKYPLMSQFYKDLFDGKTQYKLIKKFIPSYQFLFPFHPTSWFNNWFDESFTVYDHPSVFIFQNMKKNH